MRNKKWYSLYEALIVMILFVISFTTIFIYFQKNRQQHIARERDRYLQEEIRQQSAYVESVLEGQFRTLESLAEYIGAEKEKKHEVFPVLSNISIKHDEFWRMFLADINGNSVTSDGVWGNISYRRYFQEALKRERVISMPFTSQVEEGYICMMLAVPVIDSSGQVVGALGGSYKVERFGQLLMGDPGTKGEHSMLLDVEGNIIIAYSGDDFRLDAGNLFRSKESGVEFLDDDSPGKVIEAIVQKDTCTYHVQYGGEWMYATQTPFGYNEWTMVVFTDDETVDASYAYITQNARMINLFMGISAGLCFVLLLLIMNRDRRNAARESLRIRKEQMHLAMSEERYRLVARDSAAMVFEINLHDESLECNDNFREFFGDESSFEDFRHGGFVCQEDVDTYARALTDVLEGGVNTDAELRLLKADGNENWCQMLLRVLKDEQGQPARLIGMFRDIDKEKREKKLLEMKALTDIMTGLSNKMAAQELIGKVLKEQPNEVHGMLLIDLDNLKRINDYLGHAEGDKAIVAMADAMRASFRSTDIMGRVGGDEFIVFLINVKSEEKVRSLVASFIGKVSEARIGESMNQPLACSVGAVITDGNEAAFKELYKKADTSLYYVKRNGKNGFAMYQTTMDTGEYQYQYQYQEQQLLTVNRFSRTGENEFRRLFGAMAMVCDLIVSVNLTRNLYSVLEYDIFQATSCMETGEYDELLRERAGGLWEEDQERYLQKFSAEALLEARRRGEAMVHEESRQKKEDGSFEWISTDVVFVEEDGETDVLEIMISRHIEREGSEGRE